MKELKIQLPKEEESRRCVLIVIENHIGVIIRVVDNYAYVLRYLEKKEEELPPLSVQTSEEVKHTDGLI